MMSGTCSISSLMVSKYGKLLQVDTCSRAERNSGLPPEVLLSWLVFCTKAASASSAASTRSGRTNVLVLERVSNRAVLLQQQSVVRTENTYIQSWACKNRAVIDRLCSSF